MMEIVSTDAAVQIVRVTIAPTRLEASAVLLDTNEPCTVTVVKEAIAAAGVTWGIKEESLSLVVNNPGTRVVVAEGRAPVSGEPGRIEILIDAQTATSTKDGDHDRTTVSLRNAVQGQPVARVHRPGKGTDGMDVTGKALTAREGAPAVVHPSPGVAPDPNTEGLYLATRAGNAVVTADGHIDVLETVEINGTLDLTGGDVEFVGSLIVRGDIHGNTSVKVGKNLTVTGDIDDAIIEAGGDVTVKNGFMGRGSGRIVAGGSVKVQHIRNQQIVSAGEIHIERESVNGTIIAKRNIVAPRAVIAGGTLEADELVDVGVLGRQEGGQVKVRVGRRGRIVERLAAIEKESRQAEKNLVDVKAVVYKLVRLKIDTGTLPPERESMLAKLQETQRKLPQVLESLENEKKSLTEELQKVADAKLIVRQTVSDNAFIEVNGARKLTDTAITAVVFVERNGELLASGL